MKVPRPGRSPAPGRLPGRPRRKPARVESAGCGAIPWRVPAGPRPSPWSTPGPVRPGPASVLADNTGPAGGGTFPAGARAPRRGSREAPPAPDRDSSCRPGPPPVSVVLLAAAAQQPGSAGHPRCHAVQPGPEGIRFADRASLQRQDQERRLEGILGRVRVAQGPLAYPQHHRAMPPHHLLERDLPASLAA